MVGFCGNEHELDKGPLFGSSYSDGLGLAWEAPELNALTLFHEWDILCLMATIVRA